MTEKITNIYLEQGCISIPSEKRYINRGVTVGDYRSLYPEKVQYGYVQQYYDNTNEIDCSAFWNMFSQRINKLCNWVALKKNNCDELYNLSNERYTVTVRESSHPQFAEIELEIIITSNVTTDIYFNKYVLINKWNNTMSLPKHVDEFMDDLFNKITQYITETK